MPNTIYQSTLELPPTCSLGWEVRKRKTKLNHVQRLNPVQLLRTSFGNCTLYSLLSGPLRSCNSYSTRNYWTSVQVNCWTSSSLLDLVQSAVLFTATVPRTVMIRTRSDALIWPICVQSRPYSPILLPYSPNQTARNFKFGYENKLSIPLHLFLWRNSRERRSRERSRNSDKIYDNVNDIPCSSKNQGMLHCF